MLKLLDAKLEEIELVMLRLEVGFGWEIWICCVEGVCRLVSSG